MPRKVSTITVQELIDLLEDQNPEAPVYFAYNYGDHWNSKVAQGIKEVMVEKVEYSEYHRMMKIAMAVDDNDDDIEINGTPAVVIS